MPEDVQIAEPSREAILMAQALSHPVRAQILMRLNAPSRQVSPSQFSEETGKVLGDCSYHFRQLERKFKCLEVVDEIKRRGATEHVYAAIGRAMAWTAEWEMMGPMVKQLLAASILRGGVERIGASIDTGKFDARDSITAWDCQLVDERTWGELHAIHKRALEESMAVFQGGTRRIAETDEPVEKVLLTYMLAAFESDIDKPTLAD
jgi:hypothetical protein